MSKALSEEKKQQVIALGKLGWSLRKIEGETGVRRETASACFLERCPHPQMFLRRIDSLICEYRDIINLRTKEQAEGISSS